MSELFATPTAPTPEPAWLADARRRNAPYAGAGDEFLPAVLDRRRLLEALDAATARATKAESSLLTLLREFYAGGKLAQPAKPPFSDFSAEFLDGINFERELNNSWCQLKARELALPWPLPADDFAGIQARAPLPSSPAAAGSGEEEEFCGCEFPCQAGGPAVRPYCVNCRLPTRWKPAVGTVPTTAGEGKADE